MEDREIVALYFSRDEDAVGETSRKYGARLRGISRDIVEDGPTAEECENDTYLEAWNRIPPHDPSDYLFPFLARIVRNLSMDACRTRNRLKRRAVVVELSAELEACIPAPDDAACRMEYEELGRAVSRYLASLSADRQTVFVRRYWYLDSVEAIARRTGSTAGKVKMSLYRTRKGLREYLEKEGYEL